MGKYDPANLQSVKEFVQRMLDGEKFFDPIKQSWYYFDKNIGFIC